MNELKKINDMVVCGGNGGGSSTPDTDCSCKYGGSPAKYIWEYDAEDV